MATIIDEPCDGTNGASATTGNTDFTGFNPSGTVPAFSTGTKLTGTASLDCSTTGTYRYATYTSGATTSVRTVRWYFQFGANPSANAIVAAVQTSAVDRAQVRLLTDGTLQLRNVTTAVWASSSALATGTWYRAEWLVDSGGSGQRLYLYAGHSPSALYDSGWQSYTAAVFNDSKFGNLSNTTLSGLFVDSVKITDTAALIGPALTPPTVDAGVAQTIQDYHAATIDATVSGNTGTTTYAWTVVSGPSTAGSQFSTTSAVDTVFTPAGGAGAYTLQLAVSDDSGTTTDTVTVTVTALQSSDGIASIISSTGWTASTGTVTDALTDEDPGTYVTSSDNPSSLDLKYQMRGIIPPAGNYVHTLAGLGRSGGTGTVDVSLLDPTDGTTLIKKVSGTVAPATAADTAVTFLAADITALTDADWRAGVVVLLEATAS